MLTLLGVDHRVPAPYRPQEVGMGETIHREVNKQVALFLNELTKSYPQEWPQVLDLVHFIMMTTPIGESGHCPRDFDRIWSMRNHVERELMRFDVGPLVPTTQWCINNFERYRTVRSMFS